MAACRRGVPRFAPALVSWSYPFAAGVGGNGQDRSWASPLREGRPRENARSVRKLAGRHSRDHSGVEKQELTKGRQAVIYQTVVGTFDLVDELIQ